MTSAEKFVYKAVPGPAKTNVDVDPVAAEIVRNSLNSAANHMKQALVRTAFSPIIYDVLDFAVAIYDRKLRLLSQAPSLPLFMGTMNFCVGAAVEAAGGEEALDPGDILLVTDPYMTGSHPQDAAVVMPVFMDDGELIGYTTIKGHWLDIGGKEPYSTDTVDVFQEGTVYPGIKLYRRGERVEDVYRMVLANTRVPKMVAGDINAQVSGVRAGAEGLLRVVNRYGYDSFRQLVERMYDHGESVVRDYFSAIPDGRYVAEGCMDDNGVESDPIPFEVAVEVRGSTVRVDYSNAPDMQAGPVNCPLPSTVSATRVAISMLAGGSEAPTEGHFRAVEVVTRPGSMFHPISPAPCFLYGWPALQGMEVIYDAISRAVPSLVPASSGGDICGMVWWGTREKTGEPWADGSPHPVGQGAHAKGDGSTCLHIAESATRFAPLEVWEARNPWLMEKMELVADSCGAGQYRGGLGIDMHFQMLEDSYVTTVIERCKTPPWGLEGGQEARPNGGALRQADGKSTEIAKTTRMLVAKGATLELRCGGGGGYGPPAKRDRQAVLDDLREGYVTEAHAREHYAHAFDEADVRPAAE